MKNKILGPLSIIALFTAIFIGKTQAQGFEKTYSGNGGISIAKEGNLLRVETCQDSSRVDLLIDQEGNVVRTERNFKGSCGQTRLADGNFLIVTVVNDSAGRYTYIVKKTRPNGTIVWSRNLNTNTTQNTYAVHKDGSFALVGMNYFTIYLAKAYLMGFDTLGNIVYKRLLADSLTSSEVYRLRTVSDSTIYVEKVSLFDNTTQKTQLFNKNGQLIWSQPFNTNVRLLRYTPNQSKIFYSFGTCRSSCSSQFINFIDVRTGGDLGKNICCDYVFNEGTLIGRTQTNAFEIDTSDNVLMVASGETLCNGSRFCETIRSRLTIRQLTKEGKILLAKDYHPNAKLTANAVTRTDDGSIFITGAKDNKTWVLKLNCVGEAPPSVPNEMFPVDTYLGGKPSGWIKELTLNNAANPSNDSFPSAFNHLSQTYSFFFDSALTTLQRNQSYPLSIKTKVDARHSFDSLFARIWVDFNKNGQFEATESLTLTRQDSMFTTSLFVPTNAQKGMVTMRVKLHFGQAATSPKSAESDAETEDYMLNIEGTPTPCDSDTQPPTIKCPTKIVIRDTSLRFHFLRPNMSDNCSDATQLVFSANYPDSTKFPLGFTVVKYTATDRLCNKTTCSFQIEVTNGFVGITPNQLRAPYPNPTTNGTLSIDITSNKIQTIALHIINAFGQLMTQEKRELINGDNQINLNVENLPNGIYFIISDLGNERNVPMKFVKM